MACIRAIRTQTVGLKVWFPRDSPPYQLVLITNMRPSLGYILAVYNLSNLILQGFSFVDIKSYSLNPLSWSSSNHLQLVVTAWCSFLGNKTQSPRYNDRTILLASQTRRASQLSPVQASIMTFSLFFIELTLRFFCYSNIHLLHLRNPSVHFFALINFEMQFGPSSGTEFRCFM